MTDGEIAFAVVAIAVTAVGSAACVAVLFPRFRRSSPPQESSKSPDRERAALLDLAVHEAGFQAPGKPFVGGYNLYAKNLHPTATFIHLEIAEDGDHPPFRRFGEISSLGPGKSGFVSLARSKPSVRVAFEDMDGQKWLRRWVGETFHLEPIDD